MMKRWREALRVWLRSEVRLVDPEIKRLSPTLECGHQSSTFFTDVTTGKRACRACHHAKVK